MSETRACPLFAHGVSKNQIAVLLDGVTPLGSAAKRAKAETFMSAQAPTGFGVSPLGKPEGSKPYNVSLYQADGAGSFHVVDTKGGAVAAGATPRHRDFYQGFEIV